MSRLALSSAAAVFQPLDRPFSNFAYLDERFNRDDCPFPLRRIFSQARARGCRTLVVEQVPPEAAVLEEVEEIRALVPDYEVGELLRLSFWKAAVTQPAEIETAEAQDCIGYALLKRDVSASLGCNRWHVFESVITKHDHRHNYTPCDHEVPFRVGNRVLAARGVLYGQQNGLNKACAQVALRCLCAGYLGDYDLSYRRINALAFAPDAALQPGKGLTIDQVFKVLDGLRINHVRLPYFVAEEALKKAFPYHRAIYSGVENGSGSLLIFALPHLAESPNEREMHMIACFGHTFNEDTWAPTADVEYFGDDGIRYVPSDAWTSSFLVHDDNVGSNLCMPKAYLGNAARFVIPFVPLGFRYPGFIAEMIAASSFYTLFKHLAELENDWFRRLVYASDHRNIILRVLPLTKAQYLQHLGEMDDWNFQHEKKDALAELERTIATGLLWMVEVSFPELFPTNKRKVGELLLDGAQELGERMDFTKFVLARFPGAYVVRDKTDHDGVPQLRTIPSGMKSHTAVLMR